jgi:hypothetical protein
VIILFINAIYWFGIFIIPAGIICFLSLWFYLNNDIGLFLAILFGAIGILSGILLSEYIRKHYGLNNFYSRSSSTPDVGNRNKGI